MFSSMAEAFSLRYGDIGRKGELHEDETSNYLGDTRQDEHERFQHSDHDDPRTNAFSRRSWTTK